MNEIELNKIAVTKYYEYRDEFEPYGLYDYKTTFRDGFIEGYNYAKKEVTE